MPVAEGIPRGEDGAPVAVPSGRGFDYYVTQAESARESGRCAQAVPFYEQALATRPGASEALAGLGLCELGSNPSGAVTRFRATLDVNPSYSLAHWGLGEAYRRLGRRAEAIRAYNEYLALVPSGARANQVRAHIADLEGAPSAGAAQPPPPGTAAPPPPSGGSEFPAPIGTPGSGTLQQSDTLTEDSEPPLRPGERL
jgi:tetratricopeptide (TPR) repeat protein